MGQARLTNTNYRDEWPAFLQRALAKSVIGHHDESKPILVRMDKPKSQFILDELLKSVTVTEVIDNYDEQLAELFMSKNAQLYKAHSSVKQSSIADYLKQHYAKTQSWQHGTWTYYPWNGQLVHVLEESLLLELLTVRNQYLISHDEQNQWRKYRVGCVGMSVGSNGAVAIALTGGSQRLKLADGAVLSGSNLNRLRARVADIGQNKAVIIARQIYELNPYMTIEITQNNLTRSSLSNFFTKEWELDLIVDEIDDLEMKVLLRIEAKKRHIPVIMVTEPGDDAMLDVERFDLAPNLPLFHGLAGDIEIILSKGNLSQREYVKYASTIIGVKNLPLRAQQAMIKVGSELPSPPQLGSTAMLTGGIIAFAARQLAIGAPLKNGRHILSLEKSFMNKNNSLQKRFIHFRHTQALTKAMKSM